MFFWASPLQAPSLVVNLRNPRERLMIILSLFEYHYPHEFQSIVQHFEPTENSSPSRGCGIQNQHWAQELILCYPTIGSNIRRLLEIPGPKLRWRSIGRNVKGVTKCLPARSALSSQWQRIHFPSDFYFVIWSSRARSWWRNVKGVTKMSSIQICII